MKTKTNLLYGLSCNSLPFMLAQIILLEQREITVISPYLTDFPINIPNNKYVQLNSFLNFLFEISKVRMLKLLIKTRKDSYTGIERNFAEYLSNKNITLKIEDNLHKKAVITSTFFYMGSANLTYSGMNLNNEQCSIGIRAYNASLINDLLTR